MPERDVDDLCLFAHFDPHGLVDDSVLFYLEHLRQAGFAIAFVSTCDLGAEARERLRPLCLDVVTRPNVGHDFWSWREGFRRHAGRVRGSLLLANDSVYGPMTDLREAIRRLRGSGADLAGLVRSREIADHLQSWFLLFRSPLVAEGTLAEVLEQDFGAMSKPEIVRRGEVALSSRLRARGGATWALTDALPGACTDWPYNPSHFLWRELIEEGGVPFLKVDLLRDNPSEVAGTDAWRAVVAPRAPGLVPLIERHLARVGARPTPRDGRRWRRHLTPQAFIARDYRWHRWPGLRAANRLAYRGTLAGREALAAQRGQP